jgi:hypothetical protein
MIIVIMLNMLQFKWWLPVAYSVAAIILPLVFVLLKLKKAQQLSNTIK